MAPQSVDDSIAAALDALDARFAADRIAMVEHLRAQGAREDRIALFAEAQAERQAEDWLEAKRGIEACLVRARKFLAEQH